MNKLYIMPILFMFFIGLAIADECQPSYLDAHIMGYWDLNEDNFSFNDSSGNVNHFTTGDEGTNVSAIITGGQDLEFDNTEYLESGVNEQLELTQTTIMGWFKMESHTAYQTLFSISNDGDGYGFVLFMDTDPNFQYYSYQGSNPSVYEVVHGNTTFVNGAWVHTAFVYGGDNDLDVYMNGTNDTASYFKGGGGVGYPAGTQTKAKLGVRWNGGRTSYADGVFDEWAVFDVELNETCVNFMFNNGTPTAAQQPPFALPQTLMYVNINNPANNTRDNQQMDVEYTAIDVDNSTISCSLYVDAVLNLTNSSVSNNTLSYFNTTLTDGVHTFFVRCDDGDKTNQTASYTFDLDTSAPFINSVSPSSLNTTTFDNFTMNISGNVTDNALWKVNTTIYYPNASIFYNNYSGEMPNVTTYNWSWIFNTTLEPQGNWTFFCEASDSHTGKYFPPALLVKKDQDKKQLEYTFAEDVISVTLIGGNVLGQFENITTEKLVDRYTFELNFKSDINPNSIMIFRVESQESIIYLPDSIYPAHFVIADKFWVDFASVEAQIEVAEVNDTAYDVTITTANPQGKFVFNSLGGLNENNLSIEFVVQNCVPDWYCSGYGACNISDARPCNETTDNNACGIPYTGNFSEFNGTTCDYCVGNFVQLNISNCVGGSQEVCYQDLNFSTCCNITGDTIGGVGWERDCIDSGNASTDEACFAQVCSAFDYSEEDIPRAIADVIVKALIVLGIFMFILVFVWLFVFGNQLMKNPWYPFGKNKR